MQNQPELEQESLTSTSSIIRYLRSTQARTAVKSDDIIQLLSNPDGDVRVEALGFCRSFGSAFCALAGRSGIGDSAPLVRMVSAELLGQFGSVELDSHRLIAALSDQSWIVRSSAALALGCLKCAAAFEALASRLEQDPNEAVRRDIAHAIAEYGQDAIPFLESALRSEKSRIARCGLLNGYYVVAGDGLSHLMALLTDTDVMVRSNAINCWVWDEIRPQDMQKVIVALTMLIGTDDYPANIADAKQRLAEYNALQQAQARQGLEAETEFTSSATDDIAQPSQEAA